MPPSILFFFQADDGIRDLYVTGVQTCALPISSLTLKREPCHGHWTTSPSNLPSDNGPPRCEHVWATAHTSPSQRADRKSVVQGKSVDLEGRCHINKQTSLIGVDQLMQNTAKRR